MQELVREGVFTRALDAAVRHEVLVRHDQFMAQQGRQGRRRCRVQRLQGLVPEHVADDAGLLQRQPLGRAQPVQARLQYAGEGLRHRRAQQFLGVHAPGFGIGLDGLLLDQHLDQLFHVERIAFGAASDQLAQRDRHLGQLPEQFVDQQAACPFVKRVELDELQVDQAGGMRCPLEVGRA